MKTKINRPRFRRVSPEERRSRLIDASIQCLAANGIQGFTVDNICRSAGTSRGLISHHFGSKDALLVAVYSSIYDRVIVNLDALEDLPADIKRLVDAMLSDAFLNARYLNVWLALWSEIAVNPTLKAEHRKHYALYREAIARVISAIAKSRSCIADSYEVATALISLVDGLWLEQCIDPSVLSARRARELCYRLLELSLPDHRIVAPAQ